MNNTANDKIAKDSPAFIGLKNQQIPAAHMSLRLPTHSRRTTAFLYQ